MRLETYPDREMMFILLANQIAGELENALFNHDQATLAVPGGTTPGPIFDTLCDARLDWSRIFVMLTDERWVPEESDRSNTKLLRQRLLTGRAADANYVPLFRDAPAPEEALDEIEAGLASALPISILLLGMGADMHIASLFPGADRLSDALAPNAPRVLPMRADGAGEPRITLTAPVLSDAMSTHVVITGPEKREALEKAQSLPANEAPVSLVLPQATVHWAP